MKTNQAANGWSIEATSGACSAFKEILKKIYINFGNKNKTRAYPLVDCLTNESPHLTAYFLEGEKNKAWISCHTYLFE